MKNLLDPRHQKRQKLVEGLFKGDFHPQQMSKKVKEILSKKRVLDEYIISAAPEFPIEKINKVDLAILRLAVYELFIEKEAPPKVVADEAIELAKDYGSSNSFVSGAIGALLKQ